MQNKITFLGTNGWFDDESTGHTLSILIQLENYDIILDAGSGFSHIDKYHKTIGEKPIYLFLSHLHLDHIIGLHSLAKYTFQQGLNIIIAEEYLEPLHNIMRLPYTIPFNHLSYKVNFFKVPRQISNLPFKLSITPVEHSSPTIAARFHLNGKSLTFITDSGVCKNAVKLAKNSDILITECSHKSGEVNPKWPHMNPEEAANLALKAGVKELILTHFDARRYNTKELRFEAQKNAQKIFTNTRSSYDGMTIEF